MHKDITIFLTALVYLAQLKFVCKSFDNQPQAEKIRVKLNIIKLQKHAVILAR